MFPTPTTNLATFSIIILLLLPSITLAIPFPSPQVRRQSQSQSSSIITPTQVLQIAPSSGTCVGAPYPDECRTAAQVAPILTSSFQKYGITSAAEKAALISLMAFESGDFKYNKNYVPGVPGQGTRNMQSPTHNLLYASSIPALTAPLAAIPAGSSNAVRALLLANDDYDFGSAAWFLTTQCSAGMRSGLQNGGMDGWEAYLTGCVGTGVTGERQKGWERANVALGVWDLQFRWLL
ncbi:MAG: hypothetical protein M1830_004184 [Pleopsidium flavum]|nr:MAG: hypothetical protein M1830_004184 [Pleopsidium flavum]